MRFGPGYQVRIGPVLTPMVKYLIIGCGLTFLYQWAAGPSLFGIFGLIPNLVLASLYIWQLGTYLFLHADFWHLFVNMFTLWMFGPELERYWGSRQFLRFFLVTGIGAGLLSVVVDPKGVVPIIGASGSIYGFLMAYGMMFPNRRIYLYFLLPVKVKYFVAVIGVMAFYSAMKSPGSTIAHVAHLGGMIFAFLYLKRWLSLGAVRQAYHRWKLKRMRSRFRVMDEEKRNRKDDYWIQ